MMRESRRAVRNGAEHQAFLASAREQRRCRIRTARILFTLDECCDLLYENRHFVYEGCANISEYGARHGLSPAEARRLAAVGRALELSSELEARILDGRVSLEAAAIVGRVLSDPALQRGGDRWLEWAGTSSERELSKLVRKRMEEARMEQSPVPVTVFVSPQGREDFQRARTIASRKERRVLTEGETLETVVDHYLYSFDPERKAAAKPQRPPRLHSNLCEREAGQLVIRDPPGEGLRSLPHEIRRRAAQHQEPRRAFRAVNEDTQDGEEVRLPLVLVEDDEPLQSLESEHRIIEGAQVTRILQEI